MYIVKDFYPYYPQKRVFLTEKTHTLKRSSMNKNPQEYWTILKSLENKNIDADEDLKEMLKGSKSTIKHFQNQGRFSKINNDFQF